MGITLGPSRGGVLREMARLRDRTFATAPILVERREVNAATTTTRATSRCERNCNAGIATSSNQNSSAATCGSVPLIVATTGTAQHRAHLTFASVAPRGACRWGGVHMHKGPAPHRISGRPAKRAPRAMHRLCRPSASRGCRHCVSLAWRLPFHDVLPPRCSPTTQTCLRRGVDVMLFRPVLMSPGSPG